MHPSLVILAGCGTRCRSSWAAAGSSALKGDSNAAIDNRAGGVSEITFEDC
jgi:hypothetical protein